MSPFRTELNRSVRELLREEKASVRFLRRRAQAMLYLSKEMLPTDLDAILGRTDKRGRVAKES